MGRTYLRSIGHDDHGRPWPERSAISAGCPTSKYPSQTTRSATHRHQVATAGLAPTAIATPIRSLFRSQANLKVLLAEVRGVSVGDARVVLDRGALAFDFLVIATGARHSYFGRDEWADYAPGLKRIEDATHIRRRLLIGFERAEGADAPAERKSWMTFVIVGGGPTGVELAGAIAELARNGLTNDYRTIDPADARVILIQSADRLLPTFPTSLSADAREELRRLNVEVLTGAKVELITEASEARDTS